jgi:hypothetical protein
MDDSRDGSMFFILPVFGDEDVSSAKSIGRTIEENNYEKFPNSLSPSLQFK